MSNRTIITAFVFTALAGIIAFAAPIIDQEQVNLSTSATLAVGGASQQKLAQVFTAGRTGQLTHITVPIACDPNATVTVKIVKAPGDFPSSSVLAQEVLAGTTFPTIVPSPGVGFRIVRFDTPATVFSGVQYALTLEAGKESCGVYAGPPGDSYPGGTAYFDARPNPPGWIAMLPTADLAFQTFVE